MPSSATSGATIAPSRRNYRAAGLGDQVRVGRQAPEVRARTNSLRVEVNRLIREFIA